VRTWILLLLLLSLSLRLLFIPAAALAADGVLEINQVCAENGGCFTGDAAGFPVTLSQAGSYRLTGNLDVRGGESPQSTTAIEVTAEDVSVDLGGFALIGATSCGGFPFACSPTGSGVGVSSSADRTRVFGGAIRGFGGACAVVGSRAILTGLEISYCGGGGVQAGSSVRVVGNTVALNGSFGINGSSGSLLDNAVQGNDGPGIRIVSDALIRGNHVTGNLGVGIEVVSGPGLVSDNVVSSNIGFGLSLSGTTAYGGNSIVANNGLGMTPQVSGGIEIGANLCNTTTICP